MDKFIVSGGKRLSGTVSVQGAKNSALPILASSIMLEDKSVIKDCPQLLDVKTSIDIIKYLGGLVTTRQNNILVEYHKNNKWELPKDLCLKMRSSVLYIAPLLYRYKKVSIYTPGGCNIGKRPIDIHLNGLISMGATVSFKGEKTIITAPTEGLKATNYTLKLPSVGATQTLVMAACMAKGTTVLKGCAREPEIDDLILFLNKAGAKIKKKNENTLEIIGVDKLNGVNHKLIADRIVAATILAAVNACGGRVFIKNYPHEYMRCFEDYMLSSGCTIQRILDSVYVSRNRLKNINIKATTGYYPDFSTDMGPLLSAALCNNDGEFILEETIFENRFSYMEQFNNIGMDCLVVKNTYIQSKGENIIPTNLYAKDLRAGAAVTVLALAKDCRSVVYDVEHIDRGYLNLEEIFTKLGADIRRETFE